MSQTNNYGSTQTDGTPHFEINKVPDAKIQKKKCSDSKLIKGKEDLFILVSLALVYFFGFCAFSVIAPFFPIVGEQKGISTTVTGLIIGVYPLVVFLLSPIVGKFLPMIGPKFCLVGGTFLEGGTEILFGFVAHMPNNTLFIVFCFLIRMVTAIGSACSQTAVLAVLSMKFPNNMNTVFGMLEVFTGLGLMSGPAFGGLLFKAGGFKLPFIVIGGLLLLASFAVSCVLPPQKGSIEESSTKDGNDANIDKDKVKDNKNIESISSVICVPGILMMSIVTITGVMSIAFLEPTLTLHLRDVSQNSLSSLQVGLFFMTIDAVYTVCAPAVGYLTDNKVDGRYTIICGHFITFFAFLLLGPSPLISSFIKPKLWTVGLSLGIFGFAISLYIVPVLSEMSIATCNAGLPDNLGVKGIFSGLFQSCMSFGGCLGPTLGGVMDDNLSFEWTSTIFAFVLLLEGIVLIIFTSWERNSKWYKKSADCEYLLNEENSEDAFNHDTSC